MKLTNTERVLVGGILATVVFLQQEVAISHTWHIIISAVAVFLGTVGITSTNQSKEV